MSYRSLLTSLICNYEATHHSPVSLIRFNGFWMLNELCAPRCQFPAVKMLSGRHSIEFRRNSMLTMFRLSKLINHLANNALCIISINCSSRTATLHWIALESHNSIGGMVSIQFPLYLAPLILDRMVLGCVHSSTLHADSFLLGMTDARPLLLISLPQFQYR